MDYKVFDIIEFGNYWQSASKEDGKSPIKWLILENKEDRMLLLSKDIIANIRYDDIGKGETTWENSLVRKWLNNEDTLKDSFINNAFNDTEQNRILKTKVISERNNLFCAYFGKDTFDKIFLLSMDDVMIKYFHSNSERIAYPTEYVSANNAVCNIGNVFENNSYGLQWWLRNRGRLDDYVTSVLPNGKVSFCGSICYADSIFVRPALWIKK